MQLITSQSITHHGITKKNEEHILAKSSIPRHATNQQIFPIRKQCERVCYSRNSRAFHTWTIPESCFTLNPVTQFHNRYVTVDIVSPLALQIPLHNSIPLCYCWHCIWSSNSLLSIVSHNSSKLILLTSIQLSNIWVQNGVLKKVIYSILVIYEFKNVANSKMEDRRSIRMIETYDWFELSINSKIQKCMIDLNHDRKWWKKLEASVWSLRQAVLSSSSLSTTKSVACRTESHLATTHINLPLPFFPITPLW